MRSKKLSILGAALLSLLLARPASAGPLSIGDFAFDNDDFFGASFTIFNTSNDPSSLGDPGGLFTDM